MGMVGKRPIIPTNKSLLGENKYFLLMHKYLYKIFENSIEVTYV